MADIKHKNKYRDLVHAEAYDYEGMHNRGYGYPVYNKNAFGYSVPLHEKTARRTTGDANRTSSSKCYRNRVTIAIIVLACAGAAAIIIGLGLGLGLNDKHNEPTSRLASKETGRDPDFSGEVIVEDIQWAPAMADTSSSTFKENANAIEISMDAYYMTTPMAGIYDYAVVTQLWQGSVGCSVEMYLKSPEDQTSTVALEIYNNVQAGSGAEDLMNQLGQGQTNFLAEQQEKNPDERQNTVRFRISTFQEVVTSTTASPATSATDKANPVTTTKPKTEAPATGAAKTTTSSTSTTTKPKSGVTTAAMASTPTTTTNKPTTISTTTVQTTPVYEGQIAVTMEIFLPNAHWNNTLEDKTSQAFQDLEKSVVDQLDATIASLPYNKTLHEVISFTRDSDKILCTLVIGMSAPEKPELDTLTEEIRSSLQNLPESNMQLEIKTVTWARDLTEVLRNGELQIWYNMQWYPVCHSDLDDNAAEIACQDLGYKSGYLYEGLYKDNALSLSLSCNISDSDRDGVTDCSYDDITVKPYACFVAVLTCFSEPPKYSLDTLGVPYVGLVKVSLNHKVGYLCASGDISQSAIKPLCRGVDPSYYGGLVLEAYEELISGDADLWRVEAYCYRDQPLFSQCVRRGWDFVSSNDYLPKSLAADSNGTSATMDPNVVDLNGCLVYAYCFPYPFLIHRGPVSFGLVYETNIDQPAPLCRDSFTDQEASAVCGTLGYANGGVSLDYNPFPKTTATRYSPFNYKCSGTETALETCAKEERNENDPCPGPAIAKCNVPRVSKDLAVKWDLDRQTVLVYLDGQWGTICDLEQAAPWTDMEASVICRQLGYEAGVPRTRVNLVSFSPHLIRNVSCSDDALALEDCRYEKVDDDNCVNSNPIGVYCYNLADMARYDFVQGAEFNSGLVKVAWQEEEGYLCSTDVDDTVASVMCRSFGFVAGIHDLDSPDPDADLSVIWSASFDGNCDRSGHVIDVCRSSPLLNYSVNIGNEERQKICPNGYVYLQCYGPVRFSLRIPESSGVLLVWNGGRYEQICHQDLTQAGANAACREMYNRNTMKAQILNEGAYDNVGLSNTADVTCSNDAQLLSECLTLTGFSGTCKAAAILCYEGDTAPGTPPETSSEWRMQNSVVEVKAYGIWGTVCYSGWTDELASSFCRGIDSNYLYGFAARGYRTTTMPMWLKEISCNQETQDFKTCNRKAIGETAEDFCEYEGTATVFCYTGPDDIPILKLLDLEDRPTYAKGHLGLTRMKQTGYFCDGADFVIGNDAANVMCVSMGDYGGTLSNNSITTFESSSVWNGSIICGSDGTYCQHEGSFAVNVDVSGNNEICDRPVPTVLCFSSKVRLEDPEKSSGILLISNGVRWYGLCSSSFSDALATKFCLDAGYGQAGSFTATTIYSLEARTAYESMSCDGGNVNFMSCQFNNFQFKCDSIVYITCTADTA